MSATAITTGGLALRRRALTRRASALMTLARRRAALTAHNPRQIAVPLLTPILFATVIAPALSKALGGLQTHTPTTSRSCPSGRSDCSSRWPRSSPV
jgi:hypothetical protein